MGANFTKGRTMPLYEYHCQNCKLSFQVQARMSDPPPDRSPNCTGDACKIQKTLSRVFGVVAGAHPPPPVQARPAAASPMSEAEHICSKYCDQHGKSSKSP